MFRGRDTHGVWQYGDYIRYNEEFCNIKDTTIYRHAHLCHTETVGQYTGLTDKNGTKIFEGDIVEIKDFSDGCALNYQQPTARFVVTWDNAMAKFYIDYMKILPFEFDKGSTVIGNIHDNPEMLEFKSETE